MDSKHTETRSTPVRELQIKTVIGTASHPQDGSNFKKWGNNKRWQGRGDSGALVVR